MGSILRSKFLKAFSFFCIWILTWTGILAFENSVGDCEFARKNYLFDLIFSLVVGTLPPFWVAAPIATGFYKHGFQIFPRRN